MFVVQVQYPNGLNGWMTPLNKQSDGSFARLFVPKREDAEEFPTIERAAWAITQWSEGETLELQQTPTIKIVPLDFEENVHEERETMDQDSIDREIPEALVKFFGVEIRNEKNGGVSPATLRSATDSFSQAPLDVLADWCEIDISIRFFHLLKAKLVRLVGAYSPDTHLEDLI